MLSKSILGTLWVMTGKDLRFAQRGPDLRYSSVGERQLFFWPQLPHSRHLCWLAAVTKIPDASA